MVNPIDELLSRAFVPPPDDDFLPQLLETSSGRFVEIDEATPAQVRLAAKLHREIARRHQRQTERLEAFVD